MKKWHFKPWFQHIIEVITAASMVVLLGISDIDWANKWSYVVLLVLMLNVLFGIKLLERYGR